MDGSLAERMCPFSYLSDPKSGRAAVCKQTATREIETMLLVFSVKGWLSGWTELFLFSLFLCLCVCWVFLGGRGLVVDFLIFFFLA